VPIGRVGRGPRQENMQRYFHLISDQEIERLAPILEILQKNREGVLGHWYELYTIHFGHDRTFSQEEFKKYFGSDLDGVTSALLAQDIVALARNVRGVGEAMHERGVPFEEIIASMHLFEESAALYFRHKLSILAKGPDILLTFDRLSHVRMIIMAQAYFGANEARRNARARTQERELTRIEPEQRQIFHGLVGGSAPMRRLYGRIQAAAMGRASILITGESGTGKELVARAVHECGPERRAPFIAVNCAALPKELIESELFGHKKGAFSGAVGEYLGLVRAADGGTLFLDEITEMLPETQAKLLRVLQERRVRPVGATQEHEVDVRFIASTNRDAAESVAEGRFRDDLYYRLKVHTLTLPPLRERMEDVPLLVEHFVDLFNERYPREVKGVDETAMRSLLAYGWPGNIRELMNAIEVAFAYGRGERIALEDLPAEISGVKPEADARRAESVLEALGDLPTFEESERMLLVRALGVTQGNKVRAAKMLGISRKQLYAKIKKYAIAAGEE
jgi:transcriptional regulator with PAS, ATPase and Fis domain